MKKKTTEKIQINQNFFSKKPLQSAISFNYIWLYQFKI